MSYNPRRKFLTDVGRGMLVAGIGSHLACELGISAEVDAGEEASGLTFGGLEPLVDLMQQTPLEKLQPALMGEIRRGTHLQTLVAAGALANARCFAGQDYIGFHTMMALMPAWRLAEEMPTDEQPLPVLKVLYRNTARIQDTGRTERMHQIDSASLSDAKHTGKQLFAAMCAGDMQGAERTFAAIGAKTSSQAFNQLQRLVQDAPDVHRVTLAWRAWDVLQLVGFEHAQTLLRQSVRYCVQTEQERLKRNQPEPELRSLLPRLLDAYHLLPAREGTRRADADWIDQLARTIFGGSRSEAAEAVAAALAEGFATEDIGESMSLAANMLVLHDPGRSENSASSNLPRESVHGASVGVHASDAANSWRNISRISNHRNQVCSLVVGAWHTAGQMGHVSAEPFDFGADDLTAKRLNSAALLTELGQAVESGDQPRSMAVVQCWHAAGHPANPIFDTLRKYAVSEDGALHAEKYFRTVSEEFASTRADFRWRHLLGLARVSASEYGWPAPGRQQALELLRT